MSGKVQSVESSVLLDELDAMVAQVTTAALSSEVARERWAARLRAFRELRAENARLLRDVEVAECRGWNRATEEWEKQKTVLECRLAAGREALALKDELAEV